MSWVVMSSFQSDEDEPSIYQDPHSFVLLYLQFLNFTTFLIQGKKVFLCSDVSPSYIGPAYIRPPGLFSSACFCPMPATAH
eukprot:COSAG02_NODE_2402_length_8943_cov_2.854138_1_plen_80_part_10